MRPQPMIAVTDVESSSRWYQAVLGGASGHGGAEYEQILVEGTLVLQLHAQDVGHHHGSIGDPHLPLGNGVALWFETDDFEGTVERTRRTSCAVVEDVHVNPNAHHREMWVRDPDGYLVVFAEPYVDR